MFNPIFVCLAPELVIYDNSCKLHEYCLNRDLAFFKNTKFVVDGKIIWVCILVKYISYILCPSSGVAIKPL